MHETGRFINIRLHPFYQQYLRGHFACDTTVFKFDKNHDLLIRLGYYLQLQPKDYDPRDYKYGKEDFLIMIPWLRHKDPDSYNYLSKTMMDNFTRDIRMFCKGQIHFRMAELYTNFNKILSKAENFKACIDIIIEENKIDPQYYDLVKKEVDRWRKNEDMRKYRNKLKKSPVLSASK